MDGETALIYARTRHADSDYDRAARQQQVIAAVFNELTNPLNIPRWPRVLAAILNAVETDMAMPQLVGLMPGIVLYGNSPDAVEQFVIDREYIVYGNNGEALPNVDRMRPWLDVYMD